MNFLHRADAIASSVLIAQVNPFCFAIITVVVKLSQNGAYS